MTLKATHIEGHSEAMVGVTKKSYHNMLARLSFEIKSELPKRVIAICYAHNDYETFLEFLKGCMRCIMLSPAYCLTGLFLCINRDICNSIPDVANSERALSG